MQKLFPVSALAACALLLTACSNNPPAPVSRENTNAAANSAPAGGGPNGANTSGPGVVASHGGGTSNAAPAGASAPNTPPVATPELDAKIEKAVKKAGASGASAADKKAAADAYMERANFYWGAGNVQLYRFALGDYRRVLKYDPDNQEAKEKIDYLISVYRQLNRPVPDNGLEN
jgi:hypothetical protein